MDDLAGDFVNAAVIDRVLQLLGLIVIGYGVWRLVMVLLEDITENQHLRDVMEGREEPPWEPPTVRIRRPLYDQESES
jgi:hypothetical protein